MREQIHLKSVKMVAAALLITFFSTIAQGQIDPNSLFAVPQMTVVATNPLADTVVLASHGGATPNIDATSFSWMHNIPTLSVVYVAQEQQLHDIVTDSLMTFNDAVLYSDTTAAVLAKTAAYYKAQGKVVIMLGHSFGAFAVARYVSQYGTNDVDKVVLMSCRTKMDTIANYALQNGFDYIFDNEARNPHMDTVPLPTNLWGTAQLIAAIEAPYYIDSLRGKDLSKLMVEFGTLDGAVGRMTQEEVTALTNSNANVMRLDYWGHAYPPQEYLDEIITFMRDTSTPDHMPDANGILPVADYTYVASNPGADTVLLAEHGGPTEVLDGTYFNWFHSIPTMSVVYVEQYQQHYDITYDSLMTPAQATAYDDTTTAMLQKAVLYYKAQGKVVAILGHSFGALTSLKYLDNYGINDVDKMVILAGRLKFDTIVPYALFNGFQALFDANGQNPSIDATPLPPNAIVMGKLSGGMSLPNHIDTLQGMDLSKLFFEYGTNDNAVGTLTQPEIDFLNNANATILEILGWGHAIPDPIYQQQMVDFIRSPNVINSVSETQTEQKLNAYYNSTNQALLVTSKTRGILSIYALNGQIIHRSNCQQGISQITLKNISKGMYVANFTFGSSSLTTKFIVN